MATITDVALRKAKAQEMPYKIAAGTHAAQYLDERTRIMQAWADYLDGLKNGAQTVPFRRKA